MLAQKSTNTRTGVLGNHKIVCQLADVHAFWLTAFPDHVGGFRAIRKRNVLKEFNLPIGDLSPKSSPKRLAKRNQANTRKKVRKSWVCVNGGPTKWLQFVFLLSLYSQFRKVKTSTHPLLMCPKDPKIPGEPFAVH